MKDPIIPLHQPFLGDDELLAVKSVLETGWLTQGPKTAGFEHAMHGLFAGPAAGVNRPPYCVAVSSATAGLHIALEAHGIGAGDLVAVPTWTFTATAHAVELAGARPIFTDVDPVTLNMTPRLLAEACNDHAQETAAVIPVHMAGYPLAPQALIEECGEMLVIEDCAHALSGAYLTEDLQLVGNASQSDACVLSFYASKCMTTGEGGMVVTRNAAIRDRLRQLRYHGLSLDAFDRHQAQDLAYRVMGKGYKYNMNDIAAAIGLVQIGRLPDMAKMRAGIAALYGEAFKDLPLQTPPAVYGHAWHLYILQLGRAEDRRAFIAHLAERGVVCGVHYEPLHRSPYWARKYDLTASDYPNAEFLADRVVSLPIWPGMCLGRVQRVIDAVRSFFTAGTPRPAGNTSGKPRKELLH